jgi:hypothetical protein
MRVSGGTNASTPFHSQFSPLDVRARWSTEYFGKRRRRTGARALLRRIERGLSLAYLHLLLLLLVMHMLLPPHEHTRTPPSRPREQVVEQILREHTNFTLHAVVE